MVIAPSVKTDDLKYTMKPQSNVTVGDSYQINFYNGTTNAIIAQSGQFTVSKAAPNTTASAATSTTSSSSTPSKAAGTTVKAFNGAGVICGLAFLLL
jgi:hypothetical protein